MKYSTIQQHEPLRAPIKWGEDERRLITQLEEIFDDIYTRFGRLKITDMDEKLKKWFEDVDVDFEDFQAIITDIALELDEKYSKVNAIDIKADGVEIASGKYLKLKNGSYILFGTDLAAAPFSVGGGGDAEAQTVTAEQVTVGGARMPSVIVSASQPAGHNILWAKPSSAVEKQWYCAPATMSLDDTDANGYYKEYTIPYDAGDYLSGDLYYGVHAALHVYNATGAVTLTAKVKNGSDWIQIGQAAETVGIGDCVELDAVMDTAAANVMDANGGSFTLRLECSCGPTQARLNGGITLKAKNVSGTSTSACTIYYLS